MKNVLKFLASNFGGIIRAAAGIVLIALGLGVTGGMPGIVVAIIGVVPLAAGLFDFCIFAPLFAYPLGGKGLRKFVA